MIISNLIGGLGNQMFQYAAGFALAKQKHTSFKASTDMFEGYQLHNGFELARVFMVSASIANVADLRGVIGWRSGRIARKLMAKAPALAALRGRHFITDIAVTDPALIDETAYLHGYWQSEDHFKQSQDDIRSEFRFRETAEGENAAVLSRIRSQPSASVHVRRGDYLSKKNSTLYAQCSPEYYLGSLKHLTDNSGVSKFFVFSDDPGWASEFFASTVYDHEMVTHNRGHASYNDMRLMSACNHHVIANSSFSWWGAWLNSRVDKVVIAPRRWMNTVDAPTNIVPASWIRL